MSRQSKKVVAAVDELTQEEREVPLWCFVENFSSLAALLPTIGRQWVSDYHFRIFDTKSDLGMYINVQATTVVFHQFETGLREGTIYTKVPKIQKYN